MERITPNGPLRLERVIKILPVGAISITIRVPFTVKSLDELTSYHDLRFGDGTYLYEEVRRLANEVREELEPFFVRPVDGSLRDEEAYTVFCLNAQSGSANRCEDWLKLHRREVAALLTEEVDHGRLSDQEVEESTGKWLSYYEQDLVVIDWDAALVIDEPRFFEERST